MELNKTENIKLGLLALIAIMFVANAFIGEGPDSGQAGKDHNLEVNVTELSGTPPVSNLAAGYANNNPVQATTQINTAVNQPPVPKGPITGIAFAETEFDFGEIYQRTTDNKHIFKFKNTGDNPLIISNAKGACGCTVPKWPTEPIPPGGTGEIEVVYSPGSQQGVQTKAITVTANTTPPSTYLQIKANVLKVKVKETD